MLGAAAMLDISPDHAIARRTLAQFGDGFLALLGSARRPEWQWFEIVLAYNNARLPEAMMRAGLALGRDDLIACGLDTLDWIIARQTQPDGRFRAIGTASLGRDNAEPIPDQQSTQPSSRQTCT